MTLEQWEDETIREALRHANGNKSQAARALGLSRNALRYRLSKIGRSRSTRKRVATSEFSFPLAENHQPRVRSTTANRDCNSSSNRVARN